MEDPLEMLAAAWIQSPMHAAGWIWSENSAGGLDPVGEEHARPKSDRRRVQWASSLPGSGRVRDAPLQHDPPQGPCPLPDPTTRTTPAALPPERRTSCAHPGPVR